MCVPRRTAALRVLLALLAMLLPAPGARAGEGVPRHYPVIFIPGMGGSYLTTTELPPWCLDGTSPYCWYDEAAGYKVWLGVGQVAWSQTPWSDINTYLAYSDDGTPTATDSLTVSGVMRNEGGDIYGSFLNWLSETKGYREDTGWLSTFAYDFRRSIDDNALLLAALVDRVLEQTGAEKVAHCPADQELAGRPRPGPGPAVPGGLPGRLCADERHAHESCRAACGAARIPSAPL